MKLKCESCNGEGGTEELGPCYKCDGTGYHEIADILELNEFQYNTLTNAVDNGKLVLVTLHPSKTDSPEKQESFANDVKHMYQLVREGIIKDISESFAEQIQLSKFNNNRTYSVFTFTENGLKMFANYKNRKIN